MKEMRKEKINKVYTKLESEVVYNFYTAEKIEEVLAECDVEELVDLIVQFTRDETKADRCENRFEASIWFSNVIRAIREEIVSRV